MRLRRAVFDLLVACRGGPMECVWHCSDDLALAIKMGGQRVIATHHVAVS